MKTKTNFSFLITILTISLFLVFGCKKEDNGTNGDPQIPVLSTTEVSEITLTSAVSGGAITDDGGSTITDRGVCWSTTKNPTIDDNKTEDGTGAGSFTSNITDLEPYTTYYLRAYACNSAGAAYGCAMSFTTQEGSSENTFTDPRDGKVYQTVIIGNQKWMAENLAYAPSNGNYWAFDNDDANVETYGYLYDWETARFVCPCGWHLPSDREWTELTDYLGDNAGGKLKATGTDHGTGLWIPPNTGANNETGFTALPGGYRLAVGMFVNMGDLGIWYSSTKYLSDYVWSRRMSCLDSIVERRNNYKSAGFSVRCLRD